MDLTQEQVEAAAACGCVFVPASEAQVASLVDAAPRLPHRRQTRHGDARRWRLLRDAATLARLIDGRGRGGTPDKQETVQEAAAADAASEREIAGERRAGGAREVRRDRAGARPDTRRG